jgi:glycosyltransferase involved in cell wall biosynthesis
MLTAMGAHPPRLSVVTVCRGNAIELGDTLSSIASQEAPAGTQVGASWLEWLVVDGSEDTSCQRLLHQQAQNLRARGVALHHMRRQARGIYAGVNAGLAASRGLWLQVLPAGDAHADTSSLARLERHARSLSAQGGLGNRPKPAAVFGQAWVEVPGRALRWRSPDPGVRSIGRWLSHMVPCHSAMLFEGNWARRHPYREDSTIYGDRPMMRAALASTGPEVYLAEPVCRFRLGGISSGPADPATLLRRWRDPDLDRRGRSHELVKVLLFPLRGAYPNLMQGRARWLGWIC